jgi:tetratricopeptide (TPR) repeat protein
VLQAMSEGKFLSVAQLDDGFMRPTYPDQVIVSYMQSGLVFDYIDKTYGFDKIVDMLYLFPQHVNAVDALEQTLGITVEDFDAQFEDFVEAEYGLLLQQMDAWQENHRASFQGLEQEDWNGAIAAATAAIAIYPDYVEADSPYIAMARAYARLEDTENEFRTLESFWKKGGYAPRALMALAERYEERAMLTEAMEVLNDVKWTDPFMEELHGKLGDLHMTMNQPQEALTEYQILLALDPTDKADANLKLARAWNALGDEDKTMEYLLTALDIAPQYRPAQALLLELSRAPEEDTAPAQVLIEEAVDTPQAGNTEN